MAVRCSPLSPRPEIPFDGMSFNELCTKVRSAKFRKWQVDLSKKSLYSSSGKSGGALHNCSVAIDVADVVYRASAKIAGLSLSHMQQLKKSATEGPYSEPAVCGLSSASVAMSHLEINDRSNSNNGIQRRLSNNNSSSTS